MIQVKRRKRKDAQRKGREGEDQQREYTGKLKKFEDIAHVHMAHLVPLVCTCQSLQAFLRTIP